MHVSSLAGFKEFLAQPGATLTLEQHDLVPPTHRNYAVLFKPRQVAVLKRTKVGLATEGKAEPSWLDLDRASSFRFDGDRVTVDLSGNDDFGKVMVYRLSLATGDAAIKARH